MIGRFVAAAVLLAIAYLGFSSWNDAREADRQAALSQARAARLKDRVLTAARSHGAIIDWPARLVGPTGGRLSLVMTAELQDLWTTGKPVLFLGLTSNITRLDADLVEVILDYAQYVQGSTFLATELRMKLACSSSMAAPLLHLAKRPDRMGAYSDVAVIAKVDFIESSSRRETDGSVMGILTGVGTCIQLVPINEQILW